MSRREVLLFAMLLTIVALAALGGIAHEARSNAPVPNLRMRAPRPAPSASPWHGGQPAIEPVRWLERSRRKSKLPPATFVPIQMKSPTDLGVGKLLVASRGLPDPNFAQTVILLVQYDEKGALGLVLNRRTDVTLSQVLDLKAAKGRTDPVYLGGPVEHSAVFALFQSSAKLEKAEDIFGGVYLISEKSLFEQILSKGPEPSVFHVYLGYAGWTQDQLKAEVKSGAWFVFAADAAAVFNSDPDSLWPQMIRKTEMKWAKSKPFSVVFQPSLIFR